MQAANTYPVKESNCTVKIKHLTSEVFGTAYDLRHGCNLGVRKRINEIREYIKQIDNSNPFENVPK